ncbi:hypothetical protein KFE25_001778 [Diacronema lutheri]|uniref:Uncharacterized protein n=1 Tax=Diacronema lutheri TaxID=2081491 RepID=A0A8J5XH87_DIALT|nr:hypothetical protein KFE25_001778 [Diacronema lutheri]
MADPVDSLAALSISQLDDSASERLVALVLDGDASFALTAGLCDVVLLSACAPALLVGRPVLLLEAASKAAPGLFVAIGVGELGDCRQYSPAQVAAMYPLAASGSRWGVAVTVRGLAPHATPCPPLERLAGVDELLVVRAGVPMSAVPAVTFTLAPADNASGSHARGSAAQFVATFRSAARGGLPAALAAFPVSTRGGSFELTAHDDGTLRSTLTSPRPRLTGAAIAERLAARVDDPPPGMDACALS